MSQTQKNSIGSRTGPKRTDPAGQPSVVPIRDEDPLASTLPPTPLRDLLAADGASVFVLSDDDALMATVQEAGGEQYPVFPASSWQALRDAVVDRRCGIVLLDIDVITGSLADRVAELAQLNPHLVTLVASPREQADELLNLLSQRKIHRLLIKPPTVGITRLLVESAVNRHIELKQRQAAQVRPLPATSRRTDGRRRRSGGRRRLLAGGLVLGVMAAIAAFFYVSQRDEPVQTVVRRPGVDSRADTFPPVEASRPPDSAPVASSVAVDEPAAVVIDPAPALAAPIDAESSSGEDTEPTQDLQVEQPVGSPAFDELVVDSEPAGDSVVASGPAVADLEARYAAVEAALLADDLDTAEALLAELSALDPGATRASFLSSQLDRARAVAVGAAAVDGAAASAAVVAAPSELSSLIGLARTRLSQGLVLEPEGDSALDYHNRARGLDIADPDLDELSIEIGSAILSLAEAQLAADNVAAAEALLVRAQNLGLSSPDVSALELDLALAREAQARNTETALSASVVDRLERGQVFEPPGASAVDALLELEQLNPNHPALPDAFAEVRQALETLAEAAVSSGNWAEAAATIDALERVGASSASVEALRGELAFGERQMAFLAEPAPASELSVVELAAPVYPNTAIAREIEGWVDLELVVDTEGLPREVVVLSAEPEGLFEASAIEAAEAYQFVPFELDGRVYERRVRVRIRFSLE